MSNGALHSVTLEPQQMGSLSRLKGETRSHFVLAPPSPPPSERSERCLLIMIRNKRGLAPEKKSEAKPSGRFSPPLWGVDNGASEAHRSDKIMSKFERDPC